MRGGSGAKNKIHTYLTVINTAKRRNYRISQYGSHTINSQKTIVWSSGIWHLPTRLDPWPQDNNLSERLDGWFLSFDASPPSLALVPMHSDQGSRIRKDWPALKFKVSRCDRNSSDLSLWAEYMCHFQASCYTTVAIAAYERLAFSAKDIPYVPENQRYQPSDSISCHTLHCQVACCNYYVCIDISYMPRDLTSKIQLWF